MDPFIMTKFIKPKDMKGGQDPIVSLVVFEWEDKDLIGHPLEEEGVSNVSILYTLDGTISSDTLTFSYSAHTYATNLAKRPDTARSWAHS